MDVNALSQLYGSDRWPRRAELDGRCERFVIPDALFDGAGFRLVWRDALPGARHSYRSFYHRDDDCFLLFDGCNYRSLLFTNPLFRGLFHF